MYGKTSLLRKLITNTLIQGNYVVQGSLCVNSDLLTSGINQGMPSTWDCNLDISTGPNWGTDPEKAEKNLDDEGYRLRTRNMTQEDLCLTEEKRMGIKEEIVNEQSSGIYTVANRTLINKVLYTNKDAPPMVLIHVPPVLRPNGTTGVLYFQFETTFPSGRVLLLIIKSSAKNTDDISHSSQRRNKRYFHLQKPSNGGTEQTLTRTDTEGNATQSFYTFTLIRTTH